MRLLRHLQGEGIADVSREPRVDAGLAEYVVYERRGGGLAVAARYAHHLGVGVPPSELYLADDVSALGHELLYHGSLLGYARTLYHLVGIEDSLLGVVLLLPLYAVVVEHLLVLVLDGRHVADKHVEALFLGQHGSTCAALAGPEYYYSFHICCMFVRHRHGRMPRRADASCHHI